MPLTKTDLKQIDKLLEKRAQPIKEDVEQTRKDIKTVITFFDREYLELRKRVEKIEAHLNLPQVS